MPHAYGSAINGLVRQFGAYDEQVGELVDAALDQAIVVRVSGGWRPFPSAGFEITGGYTFISLTGSVSPSAVAEVLGDSDAAALTSLMLSDDISLNSQLHNFHVALGWRWVAFDHLVIRANLGYTQTLGSSSSVDIPGQPALTEQANPQVDTVLNGIYKSYSKLPFVAVSAGYRF